MKNIIFTMVIFGLLLICVQMIQLAAADSVKSCKATISNNAAKAGGADCMAIGENGAKYCPLGDQLMKKSARSICIARKKRSE
jgi:hypothetical protein